MAEPMARSPKASVRSGGRAVGLVSHVPDLRRRIPARLEVRRGREGSTLRLAAG